MDMELKTAVTQGSHALTPLINRMGAVKGPRQAASTTTLIFNVGKQISGWVARWHAPERQVIWTESHQSGPRLTLDRPQGAI